MDKKDFGEKLGAEMRFCDNKVQELTKKKEDITSAIAYWEEQASAARSMNARFVFESAETTFDK